MYKVICVGVNQGPNSAPLSYAEKDAQDVATLYRGALGPPIAEVKTLIGTEASIPAIEFELFTTSLGRPPRFLLFYFSGHGSRDGIETSTGLLSYESLIRLIRDTTVPFVTVILDVCFAASYLGFLKEAQVGGLTAPVDRRLQWLLALAASTPGSRLIFSTGPNSLSRESPALQQGVFTHFFLRALRQCRGDIRTDDYAWISDQRAFVATKRAIAAYTQGRQIPVERGLTGDFPLALSQADEALGGAYFSRAVLESGTLKVNFIVTERSGVHTALRWRLLNPSGEEIASRRYEVIPPDSNQDYHGSFEFPHVEAASDEITRLHRIAFREASLEWILTLEDDHNHILDEKVVPVRYRR